MDMALVVFGVRDGVLRVDNLRDDAVESGLLHEASGGGQARLGEGVTVGAVLRR